MTSPDRRCIQLRQINDAWLVAAAQDPAWQAVTALEFAGEERVVLANTRRESWAQFWTSHHLRNITALTPGGAGATLWPEVLASPDFLPALETITLKMVRIKHGSRRYNYDHLERFHGLPAQALPLVAAHENGLIEVRPVLRPLLRWGNLCEYTCTPEAMEEIIASPRWSQVTTLVLDSWIETNIVTLIDHLVEIDRLTHLIFHANADRRSCNAAALRRAVGLQRLEVLEYHPLLEMSAINGITAFIEGSRSQLSVFRCGIPLNSLVGKDIAASPAFARLRELDVAVDWLDTRAMMASLRLPSLRVLRLSRGVDTITCHDLPAILAAPFCAGLEVLDLSQQKRIGDEGAVLLSGSPQLSALRELNLSGSGVKKAGATALASAPALHADIRREWGKKAARLKA